MNTTLNPAQLEQIERSLTDWQVDDDIPTRPDGPEPDAMSSGQARRAWRNASGPQTEMQRV